MGHVLQQTACSVNIKQRRDYSCAIFDRHGRMLANAPHVPVHLGAMGITVRAIMQRFPVIQPGDLFLCNDPYCGGSHLPDLTVVEPVFADVHSAQLGQGTAQTTGLGQVPEANLRPHFFVANRAHHADIGGIAPGSMSVAAHCLEQEGVVISPFRLVDSGRGNWDLLAKLVGESAFPPRNWLENQADLMAQQAACERGRSLLIEYAQTLGWPTMQAYSEHLLSASQARLERFIESTLPKLTRLGSAPSLNFADVLEDGTPICVSVSRPTTTRLRIDFAGTGPASSTNLNANPSIVTAAVLYVMRCLIDDELPLNEGILQAIELLIPEGVLNPQPKLPVGLSPAVAAGNVETSQRVVDALLGALGVAAASQGTMNNLLFGNSTFGFYETICGGSGATAQSAGASAVHTHMTNTRLTDPEVLELRYPVRLLRFHVRRGSGGQGAHCGGDGVVRSFEFLQPVTVSLLSSRRSNAPFGLAGASAGSPGENWLQKPGQKAELVAANCQMEVASGTILTIYTPGGGGFGQVDNCSLKTQITDGDFS
jgi:5-oxoprolinase (ATP-hydrolysing)